MDNRDDLELALSIANKKHDIVALKIYDERETELPPMGLIKLKDAETGKYVIVDSASGKTREMYRKWWLDHLAKLDRLFKRCGVDNVAINTSEDYVKSLMTLFKKRAV